jgi:hypothetical protein
MAAGDDCFDVGNEESVEGRDYGGWYCGMGKGWWALWLLIGLLPWSLLLVLVLLG